MIRLFFISIFILTFSFIGRTTHILGGEMSYEDLGNDLYKVTFKVYRDCNLATNPYEDPAEVNVFDLTNGTSSNSPEMFPLIAIEDLHLIGATACDSAPNNACYRLLTYEKILSLPPTSGGYYVSYTRCCRTGSITNMINGLNEGMTVGTTIPGINSNIGFNSSPVIGPEPEIFLCVGVPIDFSLAGSDPDGDSLVYELVNPLSGTYDPNLPPPYPLVSFGVGYSAQQPLGASSQVSLDPVTGVLSMNPNQQGMFQFGLQVSEYRNGQLIGTTLRDFFFIVRACASLSYQADIRAQENLNGFEDYCQGLTINFVNQGDFGTYLWDFGVTNSTTDTSSLEFPSFTFPQSGIYDVSLILNPGTQCADTAFSQFKVYELPSFSIDKDSSQCLDGNAFDFQVLGNPNDSSTFTWIFDSDATLANASGSQVGPISYASSGIKPFTLYYQDNYCADTLFDSVAVVDASSITLAFTKPDEIACFPYSVQFENLSSTSGSVQFYWDFGNGMNSTGINPSTIYNVPGLYDVTLYGISDNGCADTLSITYTEYIEVFPSPTAVIDANRTYVTPYDPVVEFYNYSQNYSSFSFHVEDQIVSVDPYQHTFVQSGVHQPFLIASNDFGCVDTAFIQIDVEGEETIFIPNAFTPNGDGKNDQFVLNVFDLNDLEFRIFNRTGNVLFHTNASQAVWDGNYKGEIVPSGVYPFFMRYLDLNNIPKVIEGTITVIK